MNSTTVELHLDDRIRSQAARQEGRSAFGILLMYQGSGNHLNFELHGHPDDIKNEARRIAATDYVYRDPVSQQKLIMESRKGELYIGDKVIPFYS